MRTMILYSLMLPEHDPAFRHPVPRVVLLTTLEKMIDLNSVCDIASMEETVFRPLPELQEPCDTMSLLELYVEPKMSVTG